MEKQVSPLITVIVPVYNVEKFLSQSIKSILGQTIADLQIILVDDGSTDCSGKICDKFAAQDSRISVIHQKNSGVSVARNAGLKEATGKFIVFADSDDIVPENAYETLLGQSEGCQMVIGQVRLMTELGDLLDLTGQFGCRQIDCNEFLRDLFEERRFPYLGYPIDKIFDRELIEQNNIRFDETIKLNEDRLFVLQYLLHCKTIHCVDQVVYFYRQRSSGVIAETRRNLTVTDSEMTVIESFRKMQRICADVSDNLYYICCRKSFESALDLLNRVSKQEKEKVQVIEHFLKESAHICLKNPQYRWKEKCKIIGHTILKR